MQLAALLVLNGRLFGLAPTGQSLEMSAWLTAFRDHRSVPPSHWWTLLGRSWSVRLVGVHHLEGCVPRAGSGRDLPYRCACWQGFLRLGMPRWNASSMLI